MVAFLIGFLSQTQTDEAYIHFVGVHPDYRGRYIGQRLYEHFFEAVRGKRKKMTIKCITSPVNKQSIAFHTHMGFEVEESPWLEDGVYVHKDYDGPGLDRVLFKKEVTT
ncbi:Acetyltransferase (GNAT) family protein [Shouchella lonarensis]|uniref:Acetyltransferase (GNAT) family protein n=2 Tax=Shouchella lonarensis TaxID=1464122 RepID=A0A1G6N951_9BACI|nr:Acetyltransferase (GNAT) family protein [Shouchella lonarensis]